jgi:hypothetical protein
MTVTRYRIDPERSSVSAVARPALDGHGPLEATITGRVDIDDERRIDGEVDIRLVDGRSELVLDVVNTSPEVDVDRDGTTLLRGSASRPVGAFGLTGSPLLNPTVVLRWRAVLIPEG